MSNLKKVVCRFHADSQRGTAIIMAMLILLVLSVIGVYAVSTSTVEMKITGQERGFQEAFYTTDSGEPLGIYVTNLIIHNNFDDATDLVAPWSNVVQNSTFAELYNATRNANTIYDSSADINISSAGQSTALGLPTYVLLLVDIDRLQSQHLPGGGVEFASGYESIGQGGGGDVGVLYAVDSGGRFGLRGAG